MKDADVDSKYQLRIFPQGISIGNGLIDPKSQLTEGHTKLCSFLGLLDDEELVTLRKVQRECVDFIDQGKMIDAANVRKKKHLPHENFNFLIIIVTISSFYLY